MSGIDYTAIANSGLEGLAFGFFFFGVAYWLLRALAFEVLASPVVQTVARAAADLHAKFGGKGGGDWKVAVASGGMKILGRLFGAGGEEK